MSRQTTQHQKADKPVGRTRSGMPAWLPLAGGLLAVGIMIAMAAYVLNKDDTAPQSTPPLAEETKGPARPARAKTLDTDKLVGRWLRTDGNYVLDIRSVSADGKVDAAYFNPSPINVSKAEVTSENGEPRLLVELRDRGYEGSYYTLAHDSDTDSLAGIYHQLTMGQQFEVEFVRMAQ